MCGGLVNWKFIDNYNYVTARYECTVLISARKADYYKNRLEKANNKTMIRLLRSLDGQRIQQHPEIHSTAQGCELFSQFFSEKIDKLLSGGVCSVSTPSIGQQLKNVVSLIVSMCSIQLRTQRSQRFVVLLTKRVYWILCLLIN